MTEAPQLRTGTSSPQVTGRAARPVDPREAWKLPPRSDQHGDATSPSGQTVLTVQSVSRGEVHCPAPPQATGIRATPCTLPSECSACLARRRRTLLVLRQLFGRPPGNTIYTRGFGSTAQGQRERLLDALDPMHRQSPRRAGRKLCGFRTVGGRRDQPAEANPLRRQHFLPQPTDR